MDAPFFQDLQEAFLLVFTPVIRWFLVFLAAGGGIGAIGVVLLGTVTRLSPRA